MNNNTKRRLEQAQGLESRLEDEGRHMDANIIRELRRALVGSSQSNSRYFREIDSMRRALEGA